MNEPKKSPIERAIKDAASDRQLADEFMDSGNAAELHTLCKRMISEREQLAQAFSSIVLGWSLVDNKSATANPDAIAAIERLATEAIQFAREVVQAMKAGK